jgi:hypothetical protein
MEFNDIKAAAERSRRFTHEIDGRRFDLVTPTQFAVNLISEERRTFAKVQRQVVLAALRGWANVTTDDLRLPDLELPREPIVFSVEMAEILLNERPDWEDKLADVVSQRVKERRERLEAASGN